MQQIEDFFVQLDESDAQSAVDTPQSLPDTEVAQDIDEHITTDTDAFIEDIEQTAEEVMNAYLEAFRNFDVDAIFPLLADAAKEEFESSLPILMGELPEEVVEQVVNSELSEEMIDEALQMMRATLQPILKQVFSQAEIVSSEYVGDEFRFRLRFPADMSENLGIAGTDMTKIDVQTPPDALVKMRKVDGGWRIYEME